MMQVGGWMVEPSRCKACGTTVWWALLENGYAAPVDTQASADGALVLALSRSTLSLRAQPYDGARHWGRNRYHHHGKTCRHAAQRN